MDRIDAMQAFVLVADLKGFAPAARKLGLSASGVTRLIAALEDRVGARLLQRTTRSVTLTDVGTRYLERARRIVADVEEAEISAQAERTQPSGRLVVSAPNGFGRLHVTPLISTYLKRYPEVSGELRLSDRMINLVEDGVDCAVRIGHLADSSLQWRNVSAYAATRCRSGLTIWRWRGELNGVGGDHVATTPLRSAPPTADAGVALRRERPRCPRGLHAAICHQQRRCRDLAVRTQGGGLTRVLASSGGKVRRSITAVLESGARRFRRAAAADPPRLPDVLGRVRRRRCDLHRSRDRDRSTGISAGDEWDNRLGRSFLPTRTMCLCGHDAPSQPSTVAVLAILVVYFLIWPVWRAAIFDGESGRPEVWNAYFQDVGGRQPSALSVSRPVDRKQPSRRCPFYVIGRSRQDFWRYTLFARVRRDRRIVALVCLSVRNFFRGANPGLMASSGQRSARFRMPRWMANQLPSSSIGTNDPQLALRSHHGMWRRWSWFLA